MSDFIQYDDFAKVELKIATITSVEKVPDTDNLLRFDLDLGNEQRQVVSSIASYYTPSSLVGKQVVTVTNFAPRKLRGVMSEGMMLTAEHEETDTVVLLTTLSPVPNGSQVA